MNTNRKMAVGLAWIVLILMGAGCATMSVDSEVQAATLQDVQAQAWGEVKDLSATLSRLDADSHPGVNALVEELNRVIAEVEDLGGPHYDRIDVEALLTKNPAYWQAMTELDPADPTLLVLEAMVVAANGKAEGASDLLELVRAGPLTEEQLDLKLVLQRRTIAKWRWSPPGVDLAVVEGLPAEERWEPVKRAQQTYPDSATAAAAVLRMRADLAGVELLAEGEDQRMRDKILEAEPAAMDVLRRKQPLQAALISATGEASDAAQRVAKMLAPDGLGLVNLSEEDFERLVADFVRMDLPDWALRASRLQMAQRGQATPADIEIWRQLLPTVIGEEAATELITAWENGDVPATQVYATLPEPTGTAERPMDPVVGGLYERLLRDSILILDHTLPTESEREAVLHDQVVGARALGREDEAERALAELAMVSDDQVMLTRQRLHLATLRGDVAGAQQAVADIRKLDRRLLQSSFEVGNAEILAGNWPAAADAFERGFKNQNADFVRRGFAALHAYGAAQLAGQDRTALVEEALAIIPEEEWIHSLLLGILGRGDREQLLSMADEGRTYLVTGQRCEAFFALAFAPGRTARERRSDLEACLETGMVGYIEYEFARHYLNHSGI